MKKSFLAVAALSAIVFVGACGGDKEKPVEPASGKLTISSVEEEDGKYTVTINRVLSIRGVEIKKGKNENLSFPNKIKFSNKGDVAAMLEQVKTGATEEMPNGLSITKTTVTMGDHPKIKAEVEFEFEGGLIKTVGWKIITGKKGPFLSAPSHKVGDEFVDDVYPADRDFRRVLEEAALKEYETQGGDMSVPTDTGMVSADTAAAPAAEAPAKN